jgi:predicted small metal-binding protein
VFYHPQIVENGGLKSEGGEYEPTMTLRLTSMPRPQEIQVGGEHFRREVSTVSRSAKITCRDYGFECHYEIEGEVENVIDEYRKHSTEEHGIEYSPEALTQVILRQQG